MLSNFPIHYFFVSFHRVGGFAQPPRNNVGGKIQAGHAGYHPQQMSTPFPFVPCSLLLRYLILRPPCYWVECEFAHDAKLCSKAPNGFRIGRGAGKVWFGTQSTPGLVHYRIMASFSASHHRDLIMDRSEGIKVASQCDQFINLPFIYLTHWRGTYFPVLNGVLSSTVRFSHRRWLTYTPVYV